MYKVNLKRIRNTEKFISMVENSNGSVFLKLPNETLCDLKRNAEALQMFKMMKPGDMELDLLLTDSQDSLEFLSYMVGAGA